MTFSNLKYLGYVVSTAGIKPDLTKVQTISDWPTPTSINEVRRFLGLSNYFRKFIWGYAATASPLSDLLKGWSKRKRVCPRRQRRISALDAQATAANFSACWTSACDITVFGSTKCALMSAPALTLPDPSKRFTLVSDVSEQPFAVRAVLLQDDYPMFFSRKLSGPELNYSAWDVEMLAVICALR